ncbi:hypothetical protein C1645_831358 [Glomus cerebriforme]|uniref:Uncharacterized protein n=1 Tax=Glomus cerebriforme TaxID=658196 RepID=A0A397SM81_9GLOM|nr:hypothetical protein C1645_831358 [Glomus cerebriforme]
MNLSKVLFLVALITLNVLLISVLSAPIRLDKRPKGPIEWSGQSHKHNDIPNPPNSEQDP